MQRYQITHIGDTPRLKPLTFGTSGEIWAAYTGGSDPLSNALITRENFGSHQFIKQNWVVSIRCGKLYPAFEALPHVRYHES